jgi:hypothetical protein
MKIITHKSTQLNHTINSSNMYLNPAPVEMGTSEGTVWVLKAYNGGVGAWNCLLWYFKHTVK